MTLLDPHLDVDQVSAAVDGERDAATAAHILVCVACREQVEAWRRTLAPLRDLPTSAQADVAIAAAMAAWAPAVPVAPPVAARRRWRVPPSAVAAAVLVVLVAASIVGLRHGSGPTSSASATRAAGPSGAGSVVAPGPDVGSTGSGGTGSGGTSSGGRSPSTGGGRPTGSTVTDLGSVAGPAQLVTDLRRDVPTAGSPVAAGSHAPCQRAAARLEPGKAVYEAPVRLAGVDSQVFAFATSGGYLALVLRDPTCLLFATVRF
jgi:hypothetical protein